MYQNSKKLGAILATSTLIIKTCKKTYTPRATENSLLFPYAFHILLFEHATCIHYLFYLKKNQTKVRALLDFDSEVTAMALAYATNLGLKIRSTNVKAQKIDDSSLQTFCIALASFQVKNKLA